jgi:hypothetical protein
VLQRLPLTVVVAVLGLLPAGCTKERPASAPAGPARPTRSRLVTLHVEGMIKRQGIT